MKNKTLLVVNTGYSKKKFIFKKLKKLGLNIVCLNSVKNWADSFVDDWIIADTYKHDLAISKTKDYFRSRNIVPDGIITFWEDDVILTSKLVDEFKTIGIPGKIASKIRNKFNFRQFCKENNLPTPNHVQINSREDLPKVIENLTFPIVLKPAYGTLTAMIIKVDTAEDLEKEYDYISRNLSIDIESAFNDGLEIFAEEYIDGDEVDIDMIIQNGKLKLAIVSDNFEKSRGKFFLDSGQATPSNLPENQQQELIDMAELILEKFGVLNGCIHFEGKYSSKGPYPLEANLRMGGDYVYSYIKSAWDVDFIELAVKVALGEYIIPYKNLEIKKYVIGKDIAAEASGIISELDLPENLDDIPFVEEYMMYKELGDPVMVPPEGFETLGWVTVAGQSYPDADDNMNSLMEDIQVSVAKFDYESYAGKLENRNTSLTKILEARRYLQLRQKVNYLTSTELKKLDIGIINNFDKAETETQTIKSIVEQLRDKGYTIKYLSPNPKILLNDIIKHDVDIIMPFLDFDLDVSMDILKIIEVSNVPFVGSNSYTTQLINNKINTRKLLQFHDMTMSDWDYLYDINDNINEDIEYPVWVRYGLGGKDIKPLIAQDYEEFQAIKQQFVNKNLSPILIEEQFEVSKSVDIVIVGNSIHQPEEWAFNVFEGYTNKKATLPNQKIKNLLLETAYDIFKVVEAEDYLLVTLILDESNNPYVFDVSISFEDIIPYTKNDLDFFIELLKSSIYFYQNQTKQSK